MPRDPSREAHYPPPIRAALDAWTQSRAKAREHGRIRWKEATYPWIEEELAAGRMDALIAEIMGLVDENNAKAVRRRADRRLGAAERLWERQAVEFDSWQSRSALQRDLAGRNVWLWHGTSSALVSDIRRRGLLAEPPKKTHRSSTSGYIYLTTEAGDHGSGGSAVFYARSAAGKHGGDPVLLRVIVPWDELEPDADDEELSCGRRQFRTSSDIPAGMVREIGSERRGWPESWPKYRNQTGEDWLILVHPGSLDSYASHVQSDGLAIDLARAMIDAARDHGGPVLVVDNHDKAHDVADRIYLEFAAELARVRPDSVAMPFDEDYRSWGPFLRRLEKRIQKTGAPRSIKVGGIWWHDDLESGCASTVYRHLMGVFGRKVMVEPDRRLLGAEDDEACEPNPPSSALVLADTPAGRNLLMLDPAALKKLVSDRSFWNGTCPAGLGLATVSNGRITRHVARDGWLHGLLSAAKTVISGELTALEAELRAGEDAIEATATELGVSADEVVGALLSDAEAWGEWAAAGAL